MLDDLTLFWNVLRAYRALKEGTMDSAMLYQLLTVAAPLIGTGVTAALKWAMPRVPKPLLPVLSIVVTSLAAVVSGADGQTALLLGGSSVAVREVYDQAKKNV